MASFIQLIDFFYDLFQKSLDIYHLVRGDRAKVALGHLALALVLTCARRGSRRVALGSRPLALASALTF